jgi:hypothetical protein
MKKGRKSSFEISKNFMASSDLSECRGGTLKE